MPAWGPAFGEPEDPHAGRDPSVWPRHHLPAGTRPLRISVADPCRRRLRRNVCPKPNSSTMHVEDSNGPDGCGIFFRTSKLERKREEMFVLEADERITTNSVCIVVILRTTATTTTGAGREFCVATTHLKAKSGCEERRRQQGTHLLRHLTDHYKPLPVIVAGDLNGGHDEPMYAVFRSSELRMRSAYSLLLASSDAEPDYTSWKIRGRSPTSVGAGRVAEDSQVKVARTIDHVWFSSDRFAVTALCSVPTPEELGPDRLPSRRYPSDHLSLVVDFLLF